MDVALDERNMMWIAGEGSHWMVETACIFETIGRIYLLLIPMAYSPV